MNKGTVTLGVIVGLIVGFTTTGMMIDRQDGAYSKQIAARKSVLSVIGNTALALSGDCTATRCLTEGLSDCMGDVPGGYCWHESCDVIGCSDSGDSDIKFTLEVENAKQ